MTLSILRNILSEKALLISAPISECDIELTKLSCDSRDIQPGTLFFVKGVNFKRDYLDDAIKKGASAYVSQTAFDVPIPCFTVTDVRKAMPAVASVFYNEPSSAYPFVGITGTKGKTTSAYMLKSICDEAFGSDKTGIISTNEAAIGDIYFKKTGTTPEALELYGILDGFRSNGAKAAVAEISSNALKYNRIDGITLDIGVFLNLSPDHISPTEHSSFEDYRDSKKKIFESCRIGLVNADDAYAEYMTDGAECEILTFGLKTTCDYYAHDIKTDRGGSTFSVSGRVGLSALRVNMPGRFNIYNALCAVACANELGIGAYAIKQGLKKAVVAGRLELFEDKGVTVLVDYAHNKASFEAVFDYIDEFYPGAKKICLFGCVGKKALDRRIELPDVACPRSDLVVMTTDDPADEQPSDIFHKVEPELKRFTTPYVYIEDREKAVGYAVGQAKSGDVVFLAGKGHEKTQVVGSGTIPYKGDCETALEALKKL